MSSGMSHMSSYGQFKLNRFVPTKRTVNKTDSSGLGLFLVLTIIATVALYFPAMLIGV